MSKIAVDLHNSIRAAVRDALNSGMTGHEIVRVMESETAKLHEALPREAALEKNT